MGDVIEVLEERGFIDNMTHDAELRDYLKAPGRTCYVGFDPTASSLHVGHLLPIMALAHMQRAGHVPIALVGGGTGLIGDPSGKTEMRNMLTLEDVSKNAEALKNQLSRFLDFSDGKAMLLNNADWLVGLKYIDLLRDIGRHFSVNRMIKAESYRVRIDSEEGLSFLEFNYMILQSYDFLELSKRYGCRLQMGGSDQWGNIVAGIDLIRRVEQAASFGLTFRLITNSSGAKMGKTAEGAVWLDPERLSPYDYYQFWINTEDGDVRRFLALFTFLPLEEIREVEQLEGAELNAAKVVLAFEATRIAHGEENAVQALRDAERMFGARTIPASLCPSSTVPRTSGGDSETAVPSTPVSADELEAGIPVFKLFQMAGLTRSGGEARRLIQQGGAYINDKRIDDAEYTVTHADLEDGEISLRAGKKRYHKISVA